MINIAIDGPAGAGKSTIAKAVAAKKGFIYVDTGAMYRSMALSCLNNNIDLDDEEAVVDNCNKNNIELTYRDGRQIVILNGEDVTTQIRKEEVGKSTSKIAVYGGVREKLTKCNRKSRARIMLLWTEGILEVRFFQMQTLNFS